MKQVLSHVSGAIYVALGDSHPGRPLVREVLYTLTMMEPTRELTEAAYQWCDMLWERARQYSDWEPLLLLSLEVGFRHFHPDSWGSLRLPRAKYHEKFIPTILNTKNSEAIIDLACASYMVGNFNQGLMVCDHYIAMDIEPFAPSEKADRLRKVFSACVGLSGVGAFEVVGERSFVNLLNCLHIGLDDLIVPAKTTEWAAVLLAIIESPKEFGPLTIGPWRLLTELATLGVRESPTYRERVIEYLMGEEAWDKLECWMGFVWMACPPGPRDTMTVFDHAMTSLFDKRRSAAEKLNQWMEQWSQECGFSVPDNFKRTCKRALDNLAVSLLPSSLYIFRVSHGVSITR